jgi:hypothetical protein
MELFADPTLTTGSTRTDIAAGAAVVVVTTGVHAGPVADGPVAHFQDANTLSTCTGLTRCTGVATLPTVMRVILGVYAASITVCLSGGTDTLPA